FPPDTFTVLCACRENRFTGERNIIMVTEVISLLTTVYANPKISHALAPALIVPLTPALSPKGRGGKRFRRTGERNRSGRIAPPFKSAFWQPQQNGWQARQGKRRRKLLC
ncbi:hypothetical protein HMPREF0201_02306, partial [Cedecea davisae DSM 4568]